MAHVRGDNYSPTSTIVFNPTVLSKVENYRNNKSRSEVVNELIMLGFKYKKLQEKKKQRKSRNAI